MISVDVFLVNILGWRLAHRHKPLGTVRRHPNRIALGDRIQRLVQPIYALATRHVQAVFHDVRFDKRQRRTALIGENIHGHVECGIVGQQARQSGIVVTEERFRSHIRERPGTDVWLIDARYRYIHLFKSQNLCLLSTSQLVRCVGG